MWMWIEPAAVILLSCFRYWRNLWELFVFLEKEGKRDRSVYIPLLQGKAEDKEFMRRMDGWMDGWMAWLLDAWTEGRMDGALFFVFFVWLGGLDRILDGEIGKVDRLGGCLNNQWFRGFYWLDMIWWQNCLMKIPPVTLKELENEGGTLCFLGRKLLETKCILGIKPQVLWPIILKLMNESSTYLISFRNIKINLLGVLVE